MTISLPGVVNRILFSPWSIGQVQDEIEQTLGIQKLRLRLICNGQGLEMNKLVSNYNEVIKNDSIIIVQQRYLLTLLPSTKAIWITDHDSIGDIKQLIEEKLNIPQQRQVLFMHNDFQTNTEQTFPYSIPNVAVYVVDSEGNTALLCIELPSHTRRPLLLDKPWTVSNLNKAIERDFGYASQAQEIRLRHEAHTRSDPSQVENDRPTSESFFETQDKQMQITTGRTISLSSNTPHLFWRETSSSSDIHDSPFLPSTSIQEVIDSFARKRNVLPYRVQLFQSVSHIELANKHRPFSSYDLDAGQIIDVVIGPQVKRHVRIILSSGTILEPELFVEDHIRELKKMIADCTGIQIRYQVILTDDREVLDHESISDCLVDWNGPFNVKIELNGPLALDPSVFAPTGKENRLQERFCDCRRILLNVKGKYGASNRWLEMTGTDPEEWPVSYHGMGKRNAMSMAEEAFKLIKHYRSEFRKGIYTTPELRIAKDYATKFEHEGQPYLVLFENRVNPKYLKVIDKQQTSDGIFWVSRKYTTDDSDDDIYDLIRPYAICIFNVWHDSWLCSSAHEIKRIDEYFRHEGYLVNYKCTICVFSKACQKKRRAQKHTTTDV